MLWVCLWRWRKGTVREVLMWHSDEWVLWLDFTYWKHLSGLWESESKGLMSCETKSQGVNKFMNWFLGHISVGMIFWDCRNFVWCMPIWEIGSWGSFLPEEAASQHHQMCVGSWTLNNICARKPSMWHCFTSLISLFWIFGWISGDTDLVTNNNCSFRVGAYWGEATWTALEFCKVWHSSAWGCVQHWCFLHKNCIETKIIASRGWERLLNVGSRFKDLWSFH